MPFYNKATQTVYDRVSCMGISDIRERVVLGQSAVCFALGHRSRQHMRSLNSPLKSIINAFLNGQLGLTAWKSIVYIHPPPHLQGASRTGNSKKAQDYSCAFLLVTRTGLEPMLPPWKGGVLTAWPRGLSSKKFLFRNLLRIIQFWRSLRPCLYK